MAITIHFLVAMPLYMVCNYGGQPSAKGASLFNPFAAILFKPADRMHVIISDIGVLLWLGALIAWAYNRGLYEVTSIYLVPYLWSNHWFVMTTFLHHVDPVLPQYRNSAFTSSRAALSTLNRSFLGGPGSVGSILGWFGAHIGHGIAETHVCHHVSSRIPHYNAWEANDAITKRLAQDGVCLDGGSVSWGEVLRVFRECKFVEDTGDVVFYKNARGLAKRVAVFKDGTLGSGNSRVVEDEKTK